jgi:MFS family permease
MMASCHSQLFVISVFIYLGAFSLGFSSTVWAINSEIFPTHLAGRAVAITNAVSWLSYFIVVSFFMTIRENYAMAQYLTYAAITLLTMWFMKRVPETAGKTISENIKNIHL